MAAKKVKAAAKKASPAGSGTPHENLRTPTDVKLFGRLVVDLTLTPQTSPPSGAYLEALNLFHAGEELMLHLDKFDARAMDKARARREEVRKEQERRRKRGVTTAMKAHVLVRHGKGQANLYIARKLEIGKTTVARILKAANDENDAPDAA